MMAAWKRGVTGVFTDRRGFALISVLWGVALLTLIAAAVLSTSVGSRHASHATLERAQADALIEAGINQVILSLLDRHLGSRLRVDGSPEEFDFAGSRMKIMIQDEYGRIDLNAAEPVTLTGLFVGAGQSQADADALVDRIVAWRSTRAMSEITGAAEDEQNSARSGYLPRSGLFQSVDELMLVRGMTRDLYKRVLPMLTVYSHRQFVNQSTAPRSVLEAMSRLGGKNFLYLDDRTSGALGIGMANNGAIKDGMIAPGVALADWPFAISVEVMMPSGANYRREAVVRFTGNSKRPYWVQGWRDIGD